MAQIDDWIEDIQTAKHPSIDADQLTCAARLFHDCGLKKKEALHVKVSDIELDQNGDPVAINVGRTNKVDIPQTAQNDIKRCMNNLTDPGNQSGLLLPHYHERKTLDRHLRNTLGAGFEEIHKAGMREANDRGESYSHIAKRFGMTERSVEQSITGRITPAGKRKPDEVDRLLKYLEDIEWIKNIPELEKIEVEVADILENGTSKRFLNNKAAFEKELASEFHKRRAELTAPKASPVQPKPQTRSGSIFDFSEENVESSSHNPKSFVKKQVEEALKEKGLWYDPDAAEAEEEPILEMLKKYWFRED